MALFVDYHVHPNLSFISFLANRRAKKWWRAFAKHKLDAVICAEHAYKNPKRAYEILMKNRPEGAKTLLIPGVEALTEEGVDMVVFSKKSDIYYRFKLLKPWKLTVEELMEYILKNKSLYAFITHPYTPGTTSIVKHKGEKFAKEATKKLRAVETHNTTFENPNKLLTIFFPRTHSRMLKTQNIPKDFFSSARLKFKAAGSDAHTPSELGSGYLLPPNSNVFKAVVSNTKGKFVSNKVESTIFTRASKYFTGFSEWFIKNFFFCR